MTGSSFESSETSKFGGSQPRRPGSTRVKFRVHACTYAYKATLAAFDGAEACKQSAKHWQMCVDGMAVRFGPPPDLSSGSFVSLRTGSGKHGNDRRQEQ